MTIHYQDERTTLLCGDALAVLKTLDSESVNCIMTSPPYFGLRDYGIEGQYGHEPTPQGFAETLRDLFREARRVLTRDGALWLNLGDSYAASGGHTSNGANSIVKSQEQRDVRNIPSRNTSGLPLKNLLGIPWRTALALQDDGWILRNDIIWHKPNAMPESVTDRLSRRHEHLFLLTRSKRYHFDLDAIREPHSEVSIARRGRADLRQKEGWTEAYHGTPPKGLQRRSSAAPEKGKNPGDVWSISTKGFPEAHFATYPPDLARRCIAAGCPEGGTVLDPFSGSGTTGMAALEQGKKYIGIDLNPEYLDLSLRTRLAPHTHHEEGAAS